MQYPSKLIQYNKIKIICTKLQANYKILLSLRLSEAEFPITKRLFQQLERRAKIGCRINFLKRCIKNNITPNTIRNIKLAIYLKLLSIQCSLVYLHKVCIKKSLYLHLTLHRHIDEYEKIIVKLSITSISLINTTFSAINQCYYKSVDYKKRLIKNTHLYKKKKIIPT